MVESGGGPGGDADKVWPIIDELMDTLKALQPRLYNGVIANLKRIE